jgi:transcription elongation factor Elf1
MSYRTIYTCDRCKKDVKSVITIHAKWGNIHIGDLCENCYQYIWDAIHHMDPKLS